MSASSRWIGAGAAAYLVRLHVGRHAGEVVVDAEVEHAHVRRRAAAASAETPALPGDEGADHGRGDRGRVRRDAVRRRRRGRRRRSPPDVVDRLRRARRPGRPRPRRRGRRAGRAPRPGSPARPAAACARTSASGGGGRDGAHRLAASSRRSALPIARAYSLPTRPVRTTPMTRPQRRQASGSRRGGSTRACRPGSRRPR